MYTFYSDLTKLLEESPYIKKITALNITDSQIHEFDISCLLSPFLKKKS